VRNYIPLRWVCFLQRLFSTFPDGSPGTGLFCLRLGTGIPLILLATADVSPVPLVAATAGVLMLAGLWTPIAGAVIAVTEVWLVFAHHFPLHFLQPDDPWVHFLLALLGVGLALLGPGAWSVDARLFGRKLFVHQDRGRGGNSPPQKW